VSITVIEESADALADYGRVSIAFDVTRHYRVDCARGGLGGLMLVEESVAPYVKDYDLMSGGPTSWPGRWDVSKWGILAAHDDGMRVGGAIIASRTDELVVTGIPAETAVLWDLRVDPRFRHRGIGSLLFSRARDWCRQTGARRLEVETQNTNVPACRFYARQGCELVAIDRLAYGGEYDEVRLVWDLTI
jgi:ribosomal protein S18 acetylase RimI-like enzyme